MMNVKRIGLSWLLAGSLTWAQAPSTVTAPAVPGSPTIAPVPEWIVTSAPARYVIQMDAASKPSALSWVTLCLPDPSWVNLPIRVFTDTGVAVGSDLLWTSPGDPATLLFDSASGSKEYKVYVGSNWPAMHLDHLNSGVVMEARTGDNKVIGNLNDMLQAWNKSATVYGRAMLEGVFEGGNRFGQPGPVFEHFQGWFDVAAPEHLQLAVISNDAAFVLVDGKEVTEWHGLHDNRGGWEGEHQGAVDLTPGIHVLETYNAFVPNTNRYHQLLCSVEAKSGTQDWTMLMPKTQFFRPIGYARVVDYQVGANVPGAAGGKNASPFAIEWSMRDQSVLGADTPDIGLINVLLICRPNTKGKVTWTFDDGTTAQGQTVTHLFPRPGMRRVQVAVNDGTAILEPLDETINVHLNWQQLNGTQPQLVDAHLADLMARDPTTFTASDLAGCAAVFANFSSSEGLLKILPAICAKMKEMKEADLSSIQSAGVYLAQDDPAHFNEAEQLLKALVERCPANDPSPQVVKVGSEARLTLAQLTLETSDQAGDVKTLLDGINVVALTDREPRTCAITRADLTLATGDVDGAKKQYQALTGDPQGADARSSIRRTARIGQARAFLDQKDFASAEDALNDVAWQAPIEKLSPDWALTRLRLYQEEGLPVAAYLWAVRLLPVITDSGRSELLFRLADLGFAQGHDDVAKKALAELLEKHPYSEEAAQAKEKWPGKG